MSSAPPSSYRQLVPKSTSSHDAGKRELGNETSKPLRPGTRTLATLSSVSPKAPLTIVACDSCRRRKVKCDGAKPKCSVCVERRQQCIYRTTRRVEMTELRSVAQDHDRVLELLRTASPDTVMTLLQHLRRTESATSNLSELHAGLIPAHPPLQLDLNFRYPNAFAALEPLDVADLEFRLIDVNKHSLGATKARKRLRVSHKLCTENDPQSSGSEPVVVLKSPAEPIHFVDSRLQNLSIRQWTSVSISNSFAAKAISFYLSNEHPFLALFDSDLFLDDLVNGHGQFCSELLVSALLAWSCATYGQFDPEAKRLSPVFLDEAKIAWETSRQNPDLNSVAASILLSMTCNQHGVDRIGLMYLDASAEIGRALGLFDCLHGTALPKRFENEKMAAAASYVSWGTFGWHSLHSLYFRRQHQIRSPPFLPIPGDEDGPKLPHYMGNSFTWIAKFWLIVHGYFYDGYSAFAHATLRDAEKAYMAFLEWSRHLPETCRRSETCAHHVVLMHIWYQTAIMDVWRPFLTRDRHLKLQHFLSQDNTPVAAYNASVRQLKRLIYHFRKSFDATNLSMLVTPGYLYIVNEVFRNSTASDAQFYFLLSIHGYLAISPWCRGISGTAKAFMSLGGRVGVFGRPEWTSGLIDHVRTAVEQLDRDEIYSSLYPIYLDMDHDGMKTANMEILANEFSSLTVQNELPHKEPRRFEQQPDVWKGDQRDLNLTLSEAPQTDGSVPRDLS